MKLISRILEINTFNIKPRKTKISRIKASVPIATIKYNITKKNSIQTLSKQLKHTVLCKNSLKINANIGDNPKPTKPEI